MSIFKKSIDKRLHLLWIPTNCVGVNYWRMQVFHNQMLKKGIDSSYYTCVRDMSKIGEWEAQIKNDSRTRTEIYRLLRYCDTAIVGYLHHSHLLGIVEMFGEAKRPDVMRATNGPKTMVCDVDDLVLDTPSYNPAYKNGWKPGNDHEYVPIDHMKISDAVINSTQFLAKRHKRFNKNVYVIPNCIDFDFWTVKNNEERKRLRIGWIGGGNHMEDLRIIKNVIPIILDKYSNVEFYFSHGVPEYLKMKDNRVKWDNKWVTIDKYPQHLANYGFDIGLAPLEQNQFNCGKSNLRWLEYSILKIPTVATNIDPYTDSLRHGKTGFLCNTIQDWINALSDLIENKTLRENIGMNAYNVVKKDYSASVVTDKYIKLLRSL